jgi:hypothetical protein
VLLLIGAEEVAANSMIQNGEAHFESEVITGKSLEMSFESSDQIRTQQISDPIDANQQVGNRLHGNFIDATSLASWLKESIVKLGSLRSQVHISVLAVMVFAVIFLMQVRTFLPACYIFALSIEHFFFQGMNTSMICYDGFGMWHMQSTCLMNG